MTDYKFKVGDKVRQNGKGIPYDQNKGLVGTVTSVNYGKDRGVYPVNQVFVDFEAMQPQYYRDFELDLVEAKQDFVAFEDLRVGESYILQDTGVYGTPKVGDVVFVTWLTNGGATLKNTSDYIDEHTTNGDGVYHLHFYKPKLTKIPETTTPKAEANMSKYVTTTTEVIPAQTKVTKTINKTIDADGPGFSRLSIAPDGKTIVDIVVGGLWDERSSSSSFSKETLGELIGILKEVHEAMESF